MKNKPLFSLSKPLIVENIKMYWFLPVLSFITYFMAGIFPLLVDETKLTNENHWYINDCLNNWNIAYVMLMTAVPLIASMLMMSFLHNPVRAIAIHGQPFSKNKIFCSHAVTGWIMCVAPLAPMTLIYLLLLGTARSGDVIIWLIMSVIITTFFYGLYMLAGALVGTTVMHLLVGGILSGIVPLVTWICMMFCEGFLPGFYSMPDWISDFISWTNPLLGMLITGNGTGDYTNMQTIFYLLAGLAMMAAAYFAYSRAKLEHVGDSILYRIVEEILTWLVVFVGMSAFGWFFYEAIDGSMVMLHAGMIFGTLLTFVVVKIVLARSIKIINRQNLASLGIFMIVAVLFTSITVYDITGFAKKLPEADDVKAVSRSTFEVYGNRFFYSNFEDGFVPDSYLNQPESIEKVIQLHEYIVENNLYDRDNYSGGVEVYDDKGEITHVSNLYLTFDYELSSGRHMQRRFEVYIDQTVADMMNAIITCKEFQDDGNLAPGIKAENVSYIQVSAYDYYSYDYILEKYGEISEADYNTIDELKGYNNGEAFVIIEDTKEIEEFLAALRKDYYNRTYTLKATGEVIGDYNQIGGSLNIHGEIIMKKGSEGTIKSYTVVTNIDEVTSSSSSYKAVITDEIYASNPDDVPIASVSFTVNSRDANTLEILLGLYEREGYDYYANRIRNQK